MTASAPALATAPDGLDFSVARLFADAWDTWVAGGWAMIPIFVAAAVMFGVGASVWLRLMAKGFGAVPEKVWRLWIAHPDHREGRIGELLDETADAPTVEASVAVFAGVRKAELAPFARDLKVMKVCVAVGPLLGLLGTVTGMLATFGALATGSGGDQTMEAIAKGISEALITTETGLVVALPGMFFHYQLARKRDRYEAFLAHLETVCTQHIHRRQRAGAAA
ncbi:MAG: MotA/TolQ/ExbB proton channel family protein [Planctomycetota bacterium]|jgi:biopolymer transport protein ExbB